MHSQKYEYPSELARYFMVQGKVEGRSSLIASQLRVRFGGLSADMEKRLRATSVDEQDAIGERLLTAHTLEDALGWPDLQSEAAK